MERFMYLTKVDFLNWVRQSVKNFREDHFVSFMLPGNDKTVYLINTENNKVFMSNCSNKDSYASDIGIAVAYARAKNNRIGVLVRHAHLPDIEVGNTIIVKKAEKTYKKVVDAEFEKACKFTPSLVSLNYFVEV